MTIPPDEPPYAEDPPSPTKSDSGASTPADSAADSTVAGQPGAGQSGAGQSGAGQSDAGGSGGGGSEAGPRSDARYDDEPVLPQQTRDEDPRAWGEHADGGDSDDERILREVPPHH